MNRPAMIRCHAETLAMLFEMTGNDTRIAHDGIEAIEVAARFRPDIVLLDIGLPKLNGYDTARRIREQPWGKSMVPASIDRLG